MQDSMAARRFPRVRRVSLATQNARVPERREKIALIECATCGALIEVFTLSGVPGLAWVVVEADLCPVPPLTRCTHARTEVQRRFPEADL
jgi:hypothetical protein